MTNILFRFISGLGIAFVVFSACERVDENDPQKELKVLFIGSSFGVNTFAQFPAMATVGGLYITAVCAYQGGMTLKDLRNHIEDSSKITECFCYSSSKQKWCKWGSLTVEELLRDENWDIIILQRSAPGKDGGSDVWSDEMSEDFSFILHYIEEHTGCQPSIMFNSCFSRPVCSFAGGKEEQISQTRAIMNTARIVEEGFKIRIIPSAVAIQTARGTSLAYIKTSNSMQYQIPDMTGLGQHLDTGVGSYVLGCLLFELICEPILGVSVTELNYLPSLSDVKGLVFADQWFTRISERDAQVAIQCALYAKYNPYAYCD